MPHSYGSPFWSLFERGASSREMPAPPIKSTSPVRKTVRKSVELSIFLQLFNITKKQIVL